jgi:hypothetical protein
MKRRGQRGVWGLVLLTGLVLGACHRSPPKPEPPRPVELSLEKSFQGWQIIGEGTDFLSLQVELRPAPPEESRLSALILDRDGQPMRKITGFPVSPAVPAPGRFWIFFCLYAPDPWPQHLMESGHIRFLLLDHGKTTQLTVPHLKRWGSAGEPRIFDLPAPPDEIPGRLVIKDYSFLAQGDPREPDGYFVECRIRGSQGRWDRVEVLSELLGTEPTPELRLESDRGWMELSTGRTHSMKEAVAPARPYVEGWWDGKGIFHPDPAKIVK